VRKDKLRRLERGTRAGREVEILKEVFLNDVAQIKALVDGEEPPPPHPRARELGGGIFDGRPHVLKGGGSGPVEDLSEPEEPVEAFGAGPDA
jgi:hypothetical protein